VRVGYVFWNHGSLNLAADFEPGGSKRLADTPVVQTFRRHRTSLTAAMRFIF
jgi:hypothetical protein